MINSDKKEFLEHCKDLAMCLEEKTDKFVEIQIGWFTGFSNVDEPVTIMINHKEKWFGSFKEFGWNTNVLIDNVGKFTPLPEDYLILNSLIDEVYK